MFKIIYTAEVGYTFQLWRNNGRMLIESPPQTRKAKTLQEICDISKVFRPHRAVLVTDTTTEEPTNSWVRMGAIHTTPAD